MTDVSRSASAWVVLVVDDVPAHVELMKTLLTREGYVVFTASNGEQALEVVARERPDLVLSSSQSLSMRTSSKHVRARW